MEPSTKTRKKKSPIFEACYIKISNTKKECIFCGKVITGQSITRIKRHWAGVKGGDVLPCTNVPDSVRKSAMEDVQNWEIRQRKEKKRSAGSLTDEGPSRPHDSLNRPAHEEPSRHLPSSLGHPGVAAMTPTKPYNNDDTAASMDWAIQKWFFLNGLPSRHFFTCEFHQLCEAFIATKGSSSLHVRPPVASIDDEFILRKLEDEVAGYVRTVRCSWNSTRGCTVCFIDLGLTFHDHSSHTIVVAIARSHRGTIFLKHERIEDMKHYHHKWFAKYKGFLDSVIQDVGLDNIKQILLPSGNTLLWVTDDIDQIFSTNSVLWVTTDLPTDIQNLMSEDLAPNLALVYKHIFRYLRAVFIPYACFIVTICCCCVEGLATLQRKLKNYYNDNDDDDYDEDDDDEDDVEYDEKNIALTLSMMLNEKHTIDGLLCEMQHLVVTELSFWRSKKIYNDVCKYIKIMFRLADKDELKLPTFDELNQEREKQNVCKLIADILAGDNIIPDSIFWRSVEAYIRLYKHIHTTARHMGNDGFTFENYLIAYLEAKSIIREEDFHKEDYRSIMFLLDELLPCKGYEVTCYSCPLIRTSIVNKDQKQKIDDKLSKIMGNDADKLELEYASHPEKGNTCFKEVLSPADIIYHCKIWWENRNEKFPLLHKLAIKTLSMVCSSDHIGRVIYDMYTSMSQVHNYEKLRYLLPIRLNNHFKHIATNGQHGNSTLVDTKMVNELGDFTCQSFFDYFTIHRETLG